jgi:hypothetical protein
MCPDFASIFVREIGLLCSFLMMSLCSFDIGVVLTLETEVEPGTGGSYL